MKPETRRSLATILIGVIAMMGGMTIATGLRYRRCTNQGGTWNADLGACVDADGPIAIGLLDHLVFWGSGVLAALVIGFMLWRAFTFGRRRSAA